MENSTTGELLAAEELSMERYFYSVRSGGFFPESCKADYEASPNGWPFDAVEISNEDYRALFEGQSKGKIITANKNGYPVLSDPLLPTPEQIQQVMARKKQALMDGVRNHIEPLQDAVDLDMATEAEKSALLAWKKYRVLLNRVDISTAPDIDWPEPPGAEKTGD